MEQGRTLDNIHEEMRRKFYPTKKEAVQDYMKKAKEMREKFMAYLIDLVEQSVVDKRKKVSIPLSNREDAAKLRHIIRKIAKDLGFQVKSMKKRHVIVESTKFEIVKMEPQKEIVKKEV